MWHGIFEWTAPKMSTLRTDFLTVSICLTWLAPNMLETLAILSAKTTKSGMRASEATLEIREKTTFPEVISRPIIQKFFKYFTNNNRVNRAVFFTTNLSQILSHSKITEETSQKSEKEYSFEQLLERSANILHKLHILPHFLS